MVNSISQFAFEIVINMISDVIGRITGLSSVDFFDRRRVNSQIEDAIAKIVKPLIPFLCQEKIDEDKQHRLLQICVDELQPFKDNPELIFHGSLNGQKIFEQLYSSKPIPQTIDEDGTKEVYVLLFPRIAEILCKIPSAVREWETLAWVENFQRLDKFAEDISSLSKKVDDITHKTEDQASEMLMRVKKALLQKIGIEMDITSLRGDQPISGKLNDFFVHPTISQKVNDEKKEEQIIGNFNQSVSQFCFPQARNIIIGVAGAGKSTWTKWFQREYLSSEEEGIVIRIELREIDKANLLSLHQIVKNIAGIHYRDEISTDMISTWLENRLIIFIFDGFDEVVSSERDDIYSWIVDLGNSARGCPIVLTSRPLTTNHLQRTDFFTKQWEIDPFNHKQIVEYISKWYEHISLLPDSGRIINSNKLAEEWFKDPTLAPLTSNPLLLSTLLMVNCLDGHLPDGRSKLYERYISGMLGIWDDRRKLKAEIISITLDEKRKILRGLAMHMFLQEKDQLEENEILSWIKTFLQSISCEYSPEEILCILRERTGLIIGPGIYSFAHNTIAEFLVAECTWNGIYKDNNGKTIDRMYLLEKRNDDHWNTVIFLWAGLSSEADLITFMRSCIEMNDFRLGLGLLFDQFDKISSISIRREFLLHNLQKEFIHNSYLGKSYFGLFITPSKNKFYYRIDNLELRGIVPINSLAGLIEKAIISKTITFNDRKLSISKEQRSYIWLFSFLTLDFENQEQVENYLTNPFPSCKSHEEWEIIVLYNFLSYLKEDYYPEKFYMLVEKYFNKYLDILPFLVLSSLWWELSIYTMRSNDVSSQKIKRLEEIIDYLKIKNCLEINEKWLRGTTAWHEKFLMDKKEIDLLRSLMKHLQNNLVGLDSKDRKNLKEFVSELLEKRSQLLSE
jgi:hypothetical protein